MAVEIRKNIKDFNCQTCTAKHCDRFPDSIGPANYPIFELDGEKWNECPLPFVDDFSVHLIGLYSHYKNGLLPFGGGLYDHPKVFLDAMSIIEARLENGD